MEGNDIELLLRLPGFTKALNSRLYRSKLSEVELNITPRCFDIMKLLFDEGPMNITEAGKRLFMSKAQMTQLVVKLVNQCMVERKLKETDKRNNILYLTLLGEKAVKRHNQNYKKAAGEILASLSNKDRVALIKLLRRLQLILAKI